jgi:hypothetical protein
MNQRQVFLNKASARFLVASRHAPEQPISDFAFLCLYLLLHHGHLLHLLPPLRRVCFLFENSLANNVH